MCFSNTQAIAKHRFFFWWFVLKYAGAVTHLRMKGGADPDQITTRCLIGVCAAHTIRTAWPLSPIGRHPCCSFGFIMCLSNIFISVNGKQAISYVTLVL